MIISISGDQGSGKSTLATMLAKELGFKNYYIGGIRRGFAKKRGMTLAEYNKLGETDSSTDVEVDEWQKKLGKEEDDFIIEGRTSHYFIPHALKLYFTVDEQVAAERMWKDAQQKELRKNEDTGINSVEDVIKSSRKRVMSDKKRYKKYYDFDMYNRDDFDFIMDTTNKTIEGVFNEVLKFIQSKR